MTKKTFLLMVAGLAICGGAFAQADGPTATHTVTVSIPAVALVDIEGGSNITLGFTAPTEAGLEVTSTGENSTLWLNYSSIKSSVSTLKKISVKVNQLIDNFDITVLAGPATPTGGGDKGTASAKLTLTETDQTIIADIGSAYTGNGISNGHNLTYDLVFSSADYSELFVSTPSATVTYTIADQ